MVDEWLDFYLREEDLNILFVHEVDWMRKVVFDIQLLAEAMSLKGHRVYAIDYPSMGSNPKEEIASRAIPKSSVHLVHPSRIRIEGLSRMSSFISHYFTIERIIKKGYIDAIVLYSVPTNGLQAVYWAKKFNIPVVFRSIDVLNQLVPYPILRSITRYLEGKVYSKVDKVLTITPKLSEYVIGLGASPEKVSVLPMTVDTNLFCPSEIKNGLRSKWGLGDDDKVILFMGTLFNFSGLDSFLYHFPLIKRQVPEAKMLIVGDGEQRKKLEGIIALLDLRERVIITGFQPYQDMPQYINLADVCLNTFVSNSITKDIFPGKTVQFLACGKPLVMRSLAGVKAVISGEKQGVVYADNDNRIVAVISSLLESPEKRKEIGDNGLKYVKAHNSERVAEQLEAELVGLVDGRKSG